ncbi:MAG: amidohydrolase family protein [Bacteroidales bacterium]|nr:amidohydrolase family protein [Bacteroidales bacterium]
MRTTPVYCLLLLWFLGCGCLNKNHSGHTLIRGGTLINVTDNGADQIDIENSYVLIKDSVIVEYGSLDDKPSIPGDCQVIDATGKFITPGLIDGFGTINNQAYADAYLECGVTSVVGVESLRRGELFLDGDPSPDILMLGEVGDIKQTDEEIIRKFKYAAEKGFRLMLLMYKLTPSQLALSVDLAGRYGIATIGELGYTSYKKAAELGVQSFVHITRYSLDISPEKLRHAVAEEPFSDDMNSPKWEYYRFLSSLDTADNIFKDHTADLGASPVYLIPTLSLLYLDLPGHSNPWNDPVAKLINPDDINNPADMVTGNHDYKPVYQEAYTSLAVKQMEMANGYIKAGAKHLAGSAADVWGTMPGISLHTELELLEKAGLESRQLIAAATSNFSLAYGWNRGVIEEGCRADILILNSNPVVSIKNLRDIDKIILKGKLLESNRNK